MCASCSGSSRPTVVPATELLEQHDLDDLHAALYPLDHVVDRERRHRRRGHRLISTPVSALVRASASISTTPCSPTSMPRPERERQGVAERDQLGGALGRLDAAIRAVPTTSPLGASPRRTAAAARAPCAHAREPARVARSRACRPRRPSGRSRPRRCVWLVRQERGCAARRRSDRAPRPRGRAGAAPRGLARRSRSTRRSPCGPDRSEACPSASRAPRSAGSPGARRARRTRRRSRCGSAWRARGGARGGDRDRERPVRMIAGRMKLHSGGTSTTFTSIARRSASS